MIDSVLIINHLNDGSPFSLRPSSPIYPSAKTSDDGNKIFHQLIFFILFSVDDNNFPTIIFNSAFNIGESKSRKPILMLNNYPQGMWVGGNLHELFSGVV